MENGGAAARPYPPSLFYLIYTKSHPPLPHPTITKSLEERDSLEKRPQPHAADSRQRRHRRRDHRRDHLQHLHPEFLVQLHTRLSFLTLDFFFDYRL